MYGYRRPRPVGSAYYGQKRMRYVVSNFNNTAFARRQPRMGTIWVYNFQMATQFKSQKEAAEAMRVLPGSHIQPIAPNLWKN